MFMHSDLKVWPGEFQRRIVLVRIKLRIVNWRECPKGIHTNLKSERVSNHGIHTDSLPHAKPTYLQYWHLHFVLVALILCYMYAQHNLAKNYIL